MRYLVLGSEGQIGKALVRFLASHGHAVEGIDLVNGPHHDLRSMSPELTRQFRSADYVFFLAFDVGGSTYLKAHERTFAFADNNVRLMSSVFTALREHGTPFLFASSQMSRMTWSPYGCLKAVGEKYTDALGGRTVRLWNVYGAERDPARFHVVSDFIAAARRGHDITMRTTGREVRQMLHVEDCCRALYEVSVAAERLLEGPLDVTTFTWVQIREIADIIAEHFGVGVVPGNSGDDVQHDSRLEPSRDILQVWQPRIGLKDGILRVIDAMR